MRRYQYLFPAVCSVVLLAGCAPKNYYLKTVRSWNGATKHALYRRWGNPDSITHLLRGHRLLIYRKIERRRFPLYMAPGYAGATRQAGKVVVTRVPPTVIGGGSYDITCTTWFEVDGRKRIVGTNFYGDNCIASRAFYDKYFNPK